MPSARLVEIVGAGLTRDALRALVEEQPELVERLRGRGSFIEVLDEGLGGLEDDDRAYLEAIPPALREGVRAAVVQVIEDGKGVSLQFSPGYDFEVRLWDYGDAVGLHISGPYPPTFPRDGHLPPPAPG